MEFSSCLETDFLWRECEEAPLSRVHLSEYDLSCKNRTDNSVFFFFLTEVRKGKSYAFVNILLFWA